MTPQPPSRKPSLDELIRVKRAERPPVEFWKRFEDELRAKQLAAIVAPRPWWQSLAVLGSGRRVVAAALGAAAVVAAVGYVRTSFDPGTAVAQVASADLGAQVRVSPAAPAFAMPTAEAELVPVSSPMPAETRVADRVGATVGESSRESVVAPSVVNPVLVAARFSEVQVLPPRSAMEQALPATTLAFSTAVRTDAASPEPLAAIPSPREQRVALIANFADVAMLATPAVSSLRSRSTPRDSDLRERDLGRISIQANAFGLKL
jgi:hypothetical protein